MQLPTDLASGSSQAAASTSLWIGNVDPEVTEDRLAELFGQCGPLANVRCLPEKYCAFVNFKSKEDAQTAMHHLQVGFFLSLEKMCVRKKATDLVINFFGVWVGNIKFHIDLKISIQKY